MCMKGKSRLSKGMKQTVMGRRHIWHSQILASLLPKGLCGRGQLTKFALKDKDKQ